MKTAGKFLVVVVVVVVVAYFFEMDCLIAKR